MQVADERPDVNLLRPRRRHVLVHEAAAARGGPTLREGGLRVDHPSPVVVWKYETKKRSTKQSRQIATKVI